MYAIARSGTEEGGDFSALFLLEIEVLEKRKPLLSEDGEAVSTCAMHMSAKIYVEFETIQFYTL
ncbi:hypothetical protein A3844_23600 [Paenibacillus helianthi]|uniref:Uncharacterized protein n=1 Tax=Paenibacillus helianthi TaxID=1349432 RepID=A0ABX3EKD0_9BACL|nr:hypothetical protein A3842_15980 [Paenibacillus sp. P3E]OKP82744.1 hypothetical protein A3844_23600 [Paenibacillus helianthi]